MTAAGDRDAITINYVARHPERPRYYANDHSRDTVVIEQHVMPVVNGRHEALDLDGSGFILAKHYTAQDLKDKSSHAAYAAEIEQLLLGVTGADAVVVTGGPILRFSEKSGKAGTSDNSYPARFAHVDLSDPTGHAFSQRSQPSDRAVTRAVHYNVWRVLSLPPQDVPLAICNARSLQGSELIPADAIFDRPDGNDWSFEGYVVAHDAAHRWAWFPDMAPDEAIVFKTHDSRGGVARCVPHVAFDDPHCPENAQPRVSAEIRAIAYWW